MWRLVFWPDSLPLTMLLLPLRDQMVEANVQKWRRRLLDPSALLSSAELREVFSEGNFLRDWLLRPHREMTFYMTQICTGHSCFDSYVHRIKWATTAHCILCGGIPDDRNHTVEDCPEHHEARLRFVSSNGGDLSLAGLLGGALTSVVKWMALSKFCEELITPKANRARKLQQNEVRLCRGNHKGLHSIVCMVRCFFHGHLCSAWVGILALRYPPPQSDGRSS